jgi:hypothetical protein
VDEDWVRWSQTIVDRIADLQRQVRDLQAQAKVTRKLFLEYSEVDNRPKVIRLIESVCLKLLQERRVMRDTGVWSDATFYGPGATVSHNGAAWVAQIENKGLRPGAGNTGWRLAVKSDTSGLRRLVRDELAKVPVVR